MMKEVASQTLLYVLLGNAFVFLSPHVVEVASKTLERDRYLHFTKVLNLESAGHKQL